MPPTHAVIVGIDQYPEGLQQLSRAANDAEKIIKYLSTELKADEKNITFLKDGGAKKADIIEAVSSLEKKASRNDSIIFFFSGYAGQTQTDVEGEKEGILCPVDVLTEGGISDSSLLMLFRQVSKSCGNNITVLLDCPAKIFGWENPSSFVVVAPDTAKEGADGGAFTEAMLKVLNDKRDLVKSMTVEAFAGHVQAAMDGVEVCAFGVNVNRQLFNVRGDSSHHAFIPGRTLSDGRIVLCIGLAQGVRVGAIYGIYPGNIKGLKRLGSLVVKALDDNGMMATFYDSSDDFDVPNFFYAVEEDRYFEPVGMFVSTSPNTGVQPLAQYSGWTNASEAEATITAEVDEDDGDVSMKWNGFADDPKFLQTEFDVTFDLTDRDNIQREIRRGARFHHLVGAPPPTMSSISDGLRIRFGKFNDHNDNILDSDRFDGVKEIKLGVKKGEQRGPYSLTIVNNNEHSVWPYVFLCDPERFTIRSWYRPPPGLLKAPLEAKKELVIGSETDQRSFIMSYRYGRARDYTYLKIFVAKERMDFTAFQQWFTSQTEDQLRGHFTFKNTDMAASSSIPELLTSPGKEKETDSKKLVKSSPWASMRLTIFETFVDST
ncbi:hypothetical protein NLJ89_g7349 [Agrocybe chaxingu]|uniref:Peptidase C14 caspase domain-containing protein n=1 Tax=Agrocybe chaxingu TaxID=84603 RepID=A0A9W8K3T7_9AGAR|nr:hypothetical protein NLJ89_g7349 [Agrocybe chaxingu]